MVDTIWTQCLLEIMRLSEIRLNGKEQEIELSEVDRLAALVTQEMRMDATVYIRRVVGNPENKFDDPIPF